MNPPPPQHRNTSGSRFTQRLGYFLTGTAIGLIALGFLMSSRQRAAQQQTVEQAAQRAEELGAEIRRSDAEFRESLPDSVEAQGGEQDAEPVVPEDDGSDADRP